ncbi:MAG: hypothetical protein JSV38_01670 [Desulfobacterales bacterium]|nr:MAG: hypothetical protein JSV38_01670 [Desulfobacterales bacterium]
MELAANEINLPKTIGAWTRPDAAQLIDSTNIFKYMNGAGELYLSYGFSNLEVYEYTADNQKSILVELYYMKTSDDAFGLLSLDWGGEPVTFSQSSVGKRPYPIAPPVRALYGKGLLRIWSDNIYARIMAEYETPDSKEAVLSLGRAIVANRKNPPRPRLLNTLPQTIDSDWTLRNDRIGYFHSYLVLNILYYISHQNILNLDHSTEAVTSPYEKTINGDLKRVQLLFVKYSGSTQAQQALEKFHKAYLPERNKYFVDSSMNERPNFFKIEDGWLGYKLHGPFIALVFECPDLISAQSILKQIQINLIKMGNNHAK